MIKKVIAAILGALLALCVAMLIKHGSVDHLKYSLGLWDKEAARKEVLAALDSFTQYYSKFFNTGGDLEGLGVFPAANLVKRRIVQDINAWTDQNLVLVYDKFGFEVESVEVLSPEKSLVVTKESWALMVRQRDNRSIGKGMQSLSMRVRYIFGREAGIWKVQEYEVYTIDDDIQPFKERSGL